MALVLRVEALEQAWWASAQTCRHARVKDAGTFGEPLLTCLDCHRRVDPDDVPDDAEIDA